MGQISPLLEAISRASYFDHSKLPAEVQPIFEQRKKIAMRILELDSPSDRKEYYNMFDWCNGEIKKFFAIW